MAFANCDSSKDKTTFASGSMQLAEADTCHFNWDLTSLDLDFLDELSGFKQFTAIFKYSIPLAAFFKINMTNIALTCKGL